MESDVHTRAPLSPLRRAGLWLVAWLVMFFSGPGWLFWEGSAFVAGIGLAIGFAAAARPGRAAFWVEWGLASIGFTLLNAWMRHVWWGTYFFVGPVPGLYAALGLVLLRRLDRFKVPFGLAAAATWTCAETLRYLVDPPFGYHWMRLGVFAADVPESARLFGVGGLGFLIAFCAGAAAERFVRSKGAGRSLLPRLLGAGSVFVVLLIGLALGRLLPPPATRPGPSVLCIQPAIEQARKQQTATQEELFTELLSLTREGLDAAPEPPDLVAWGETMFPFPTVAEECLAAWDAGVRPAPWSRDKIDPRTMRLMLAREREFLAGLFGSVRRKGLLPSGTSFLSGAVDLRVLDGVLRRFNAVHLWNGEGRPRLSGAKVHLVPGGETMAGFERLEFIRDITLSVAGYLPDLASDKESAVLTLEGREGQRWRMGVSVCFDNAYDDPYTAPLRRGPVDFYLVVSNEAWFLESFEMDQMIAFSRLLAVASGRSILRVTNSGVTALVDPAGHVTRLERGGVDRSVRGAELFRVPVPVKDALLGPGTGPEHRPRPPFVALEPFWLGLWLVLPLLLLLLASRGRPWRNPGSGDSGGNQLGTSG